MMQQLELGLEMDASAHQVTEQTLRARERRNFFDQAEDILSVYGETIDPALVVDDYSIRSAKYGYTTEVVRSPGVPYSSDNGPVELRVQKKSTTFHRHGRRSVAIVIHEVPLLHLDSPRNFFMVRQGYWEIDGIEGHRTSRFYDASHNNASLEDLREANDRLDHIVTALSNT